MRKTVLAALLLASTAAQAQLVVTQQSITHQEKAGKIAVLYPQTGNVIIDGALAAFAKETAAYVESDNASSVTMDYRVLRNDDQMFAVAMDGSVDYGGAHPLSCGRFFSFLMPDAVHVFLPELVDGKRGMKKISALAQAELKKTYIKGSSSNDDILHDIEVGAGPNALGHTAFVWQPTELVLSFSSYELFGYPAGPDVHIPMQALSDVLRANPRAPLPSFDCAKSRSAIEQTLCGDVELARQDRDLAGIYENAIAHDKYMIRHDPLIAASKRSQLQTLIAEQRAWQKDRDLECASGDAACLAASYKKRLKETYRF